MNITKYEFFKLAENCDLRTGQLFVSLFIKNPYSRMYNETSHKRVKYNIDKWLLAHHYFGEDMPPMTESGKRLYKQLTSK